MKPSMRQPAANQEAKPPHPPQPQQPLPPRRQIQPRENIIYTPMSMIKMQTPRDEVNTSLSKATTKTIGQQLVQSAASNRAVAIERRKIVRRAPTMSLSGVSDIHKFVNVRTPSKQYEYAPLRTIASTSNDMTMIASNEDLNQRVLTPNILSPNAMTQASTNAGT